MKPKQRTIPFKKKKKNTLKTEEKIYIGIGVSLFFVVSLLFIIFGPFFKIQNILIETSENSSVININQAYDNINSYRGKNIFTLNAEALKDTLKRNQNTIKNVGVQKQFPNTLRITLTSHEIIFQTEKYFILQNGSLVEKTLDKSSYTLLKVSEDLDEFALFNTTLKAGELRNIQILIAELEKNILGFGVKTLYYLPTEQELLIENTLGNIFIFTISGDIFEQIGRLSIYSQEGGNVSEQRYVYIDVRISQKLFVCDYENEFLCKKNLRDIYGETILENFVEESSEPLLSVLNFYHHETAGHQPV